MSKSLLESIRKDKLNQSILIGDMVTWGDSSRYSGTNLGIVLKYAPKKIVTSAGNVDASNCIVITEQFKNTSAEMYERWEKMYKDNKHKMVKLSDTKPPKRKLTYQACVKYLTQNNAKADERIYWGWQLQVTVLADGEIIGKKSSTSQHGAFKGRIDLNNNVYEGDFSLHRDYSEETIQDGWRKGQTKLVKNGELVLQDSYSCVHHKDYVLVGKLIKKLLGDIPTESFTKDFSSIDDLLDFMLERGIRINGKEKYTHSGINILGKAMQSRAKQ